MKKRKVLSLMLAASLVIGSVSLLPKNAFTEKTDITASAENQDVWEYDENYWSGMTITGYRGKSKEIKIPSKIAGKAVQCVSGFTNCNNLTKITISAGIEKIGGYAFNGLKNLKSVVIEKGVDEIEMSAFSGCTALESVSIPSSVATIGMDAFKDTKWLENEKKKNTVAVVNGIILGCDKTASKIKIPNTVKNISMWAFNNCSKLESVEIPNSVTTIAYKSFANCTSLKSVKIPKSVQNIESFAFDNCTKMGAVNVDGANKAYSSVDGVVYNKNKTQLIKYPETKSSYNVPKTVSEIRVDALNNCKKIKAVDVPEKSTDLFGMFEGCSNLEKINVSSKNPMYTSVDGVVYSKDKKTLVKCPEGKTSITIPNTVTDIDYFAAKDCSKIVSVNIPENVKQIGPYAFHGCRSLQYLYIPAGVESIGNGAFWDCKSLTTVSIPKDTSVYGSFGFYTLQKNGQFLTEKTPGFKMICYKNSSAENDAKQNNLSYDFLYQPVKRFSGNGRFDTAAKISKGSFDSSSTVVLAFGFNYADALAGVPLAKKLNAPILLTSKDTLETETIEEINRLGAKNIIILGGEGAIGKKVVDVLKKNGIKEKNIKRYAGKSRFGTATAIANSITKEPTELFFVYAFGFADALSASTVAASKGAPIIYLNKTGDIDEDTLKYLSSVKNKVKKAYVIGGEGVISKDMMKKAGDALGLTVGKTITRVAGQDRYATCIKINDTFADVLKGTEICVAKGLDFPDALSGGVYAAMKGSALFLADNKLANTQVDFLRKKKASGINVFGGVGAVPDRLVQSISAKSV